MPILQLNQKRHDDLEQQTDGTRLRIYYQAITDGIDDANAVRQGAGVPRVGEVLFALPYLTCRRVFVQGTEHPEVFAIEAEFGSGKYEKIVYDNPLDEPAVVTWDSTSSFVPIYIDRDGTPIVNSAGCTFDPTIEEEVFDLVLTVERNELTFDPIQASAYHGAVNSDGFLGFAPGTAQLRKRKATSQTKTFEDGAVLHFWRVYTEIQFRWDGWARKVIDEGSVQIDPDEPTELLVAKDSLGYPMNSVVPLNGAGEPLAAGATPITLTFYTKRELPFGALLI